MSRCSLILLIHYLLKYNKKNSGFGTGEEFCRSSDFSFLAIVVSFILRAANLRRFEW